MVREARPKQAKPPPDLQDALGEAIESISRMTDELRALRQEVREIRDQLGHLEGSVTELGENLADPDEGWRLRPDVKRGLEESLDTPRESLLTSDEAWKEGLHALETEVRRLRGNIEARLVPGGHAATSPIPTDFWQPRPFEDLAAEQQIRPVTDWDQFAGGWPPDEDFDAFVKAVRLGKAD